MITAEALLLAAQHAAADLQRLRDMVVQVATALAAAEERATIAEAALKRAKQRQAQLTTAPADLARAARAHLDRIDCITTEEFQCGAEQAEREALRSILETIEQREA